MSDNNDGSSSPGKRRKADIVPAVRNGKKNRKHNFNFYFNFYFL